MEDSGISQSPSVHHDHKLASGVSVCNLLERIKKLQGDPTSVLQSKSILLRHVSQFPKEERVLAEGNWQGPEFWSPAVLSYHVPTECVRVWIVTREFQIETKTPKYFHARIPYQSIAAEVLSEGAEGTI